MASKSPVGLDDSALPSSVENKDSSFTPQQSSRISITIESDNDTWTEYLAIVEMLNMNPREKKKNNTYQLQVRSLFESKASGKKVWDEPPSGAKNVTWASDDVKLMAEVQMKDLKVLEAGGGKRGQPEHTHFQVRDEEIIDADHLNTAGIAPESMKQPNGKKSWMKRFGKIVRETIPKRKIDKGGGSPLQFAYREGSNTAEFAMGTKSQNKTNHGQDGRRQGLDIDDINIQRAIAQSQNPMHDNLRYSLETEEAMAMAKALSLSEVEYKHDGTGSHNKTNYGQNDGSQGLDIDEFNSQRTIPHIQDPMRDSLPNSLESEEAMTMAKALSLSEAEYKQDMNHGLYPSHLEAITEAPMSAEREIPYALDRKMSPEELEASLQ